MAGHRSPVQTRSVLQDGRIVPPTGLEVIVADHCNIACRQCNHGSPVMPKWLLRPDDLAQHLGLLGDHYRPAFLKYIGGEPLLHPNLAAILRAGREAGISPHHLLVTNGILLDRLTPEIWALLDEIEVSVYPDTGVTDEALLRHKTTAAQHGVKLTVNDFPQFRRTFTRVRNDDDALVQQIFRACKPANVWGCHTLYKGAIYRCPQSAYALRLADAEGSDGFILTQDEKLTERLLAFLNNPEPLLSCRYCVGTTGRKQPHKLLARREWATDLDEPVQDMLDAALLQSGLHTAVTLDDCKTPEHRRGNAVLRRWLGALGVQSKRIRRASFRKDAD